MLDVIFSGKERFILQFAARMAQFGEGVFARLAAAKKKKIAAGDEVFDLSIGAPNIPPVEEVRRALADAAMAPGNYVYAITDSDELLCAVRDWYDSRYGVTLDKDTEICSLLGSQEGLSHIALTLIDDGDLALVPDPCYPIFADGQRLAGAKIGYMPQKAEHDYVIQLKDIPPATAERAKFMLVSYPNNPTTATAPAEFYEELIAFAKKYDIVVLHDNAYSELVFDGHSCGSFLEYPGAKEVGVEFNSLSKTYGLAGARIGFCVGNRELVGYVKKLKSNIDYGMFLPVQKAAIAALSLPRAVVEGTRLAYERRRNVLVEGLVSAGWQMDKPPATMFVWAPVPKGFGSSEEFVRRLLDDAGVLVTPGSAFGPSGEGFVRMALVQSEETLGKITAKVRGSGLFK